MWLRTIVGLFCLALFAPLAYCGDKPFKPVRKREMDPLEGIWEAAVNTPDGWSGTLRATVSFKPIDEEDSPFHGTIEIEHKLQRKGGKRSGTTGTIVITPVKRDKERSLHSLSLLDYTTLRLQEFKIADGEQKLAELEKKKNKEDAPVIAQLRKDIDEFKKLAAPLRPSDKNTAAYTFDGDTWTIASKGLILPEPIGVKMPWGDKIVWKKVTNALSPQDLAEGWRLLYDGKTTTGWKSEGEVVSRDGVLIVGGSKKATLATEAALGNIKMEFEFRWQGKVLPEISYPRAGKLTFMPLAGDAKPLGVKLTDRILPPGKSWNHLKFHFERDDRKDKPSIQLLQSLKTKSGSWSVGFQLVGEKLKGFRIWGYRNDDTHAFGNDNLDFEIKFLDERVPKGMPPSALRFEVAEGTVLEVRNVKIKALTAAQK